MKPKQLFKTYLQNDNKNIFCIFDNEKLNIDWKNVSILDYGCNQGNFLNSAIGNINNERYLGIDIIEMAIDTAKLTHPECRFMHYNKWHQAYNPTGNKTIKVFDVVDEKFDVIICYSVFTHTTIEQTKDELNELKQLLNSNGIILFTIWRSNIFKPYYNWVSERFEDVISIDFNNINYKNMAYWINTSEVVTDTINFVSDNTISSFNTFYDIEWVKEELKPATHLDIPKYQYQDLFCLRN